MADPRVVRAIIRRGRQEPRKRRRRYTKAALETGIVESGLRNLPGGSADSQGWRQERRQFYKNPRNVRASVDRFFREARQHDHGQSAGQLAADVQRPRADLRGRYGQVSGQAKALLNRNVRRRGGWKSASGGSKVLSRAQVSPTPGKQVAPGGVGVAALLSHNMTQPQVPISEPPEPTFSAHHRLALPKSYGGVLSLSTGPPQPREDTLAGQLRQIQALTGSVTSQPKVNVTGQNRVAATGGKVRGRTAVVGDSLGVGTTPYLRAALGGRVKADVKVGRSSKAAVRAARQFPGARRIVFDAGTNDPTRHAFARSLRRLDRVTGRKPIYVPTVHGPRAKQKNRALRRIARNRRDIHLVRWRAPLSDGIHPTASGYQQRAAQIAAAIRADQPKGYRTVRGVPQGTRHLRGTSRFEGRTVAAWIKPWLKYARRHGWKGQVTSGYRSYADQARIYASGVRPAARPGTSNHEGANFPRGAVDVSDAAQLSRILERARRRGHKVPLRWAGGKDPVHFSHPHGGSY